MKHEDWTKDDWYPTADDARRYGFEWGPMRVTRMAHIEGRGYCIEIATEHARLQVLVSEKGRKITTYPIRSASEHGTGKSNADPQQVEAASEPQSA
jgi:hypothetical protein